MQNVSDRKFEIDRFVDTRALPSLPAAAMKLLELARREDVETAEIASVVRLDPAISDRLMTTVNSALMAFRPKVETIEDAVNKLGLNMVRTLMLSFHLASHEYPEHEMQEAIQAHWRSSLTQAVIAELLAGHIDADPAQCFLAAMVQDVGVLAILCEEPELYTEQVLRFRRFPDVATAEASLFGFGHEEVSAKIIRKWGLSAEFEEAVLRHHEQFTSPEEGEELLAVSQAAHLGAKVLLSENDEDTRHFMGSWMCYLESVFGLRPETVSELVSDVNTLVGSYAAVFQVDIGENINEEQALVQAKNLLQKIALESQIQLDTARRLNQENTADCAIYRDPLTGLLNRRYLNEHMRELSIEAIRKGTDLAVLFIDLDNFKSVNDSLGHACGDKAIIHVARWLHKSIRRDDIAVRLGGDEFLLVLKQINFKGFERVAKRITAEVPVLKFDDQLVPISLSVGGVFYSPDGDDLPDPDWLVDQADQLMYQAKRCKKGSAVLRRLERAAERF